MTGLFEKLGAEYIDHVAVTTADLQATLNDWLALPGARLLRGPGENHVQKCHYAFVRASADLVVEILAPLSDDSPISAHLSRGGGTYHFCFAVADMDNAIRAAEEAGARVVVAPVADVAFDGRRVAFLVHPDHGLFELVEARPACAPMPRPVETAEQPAAAPMAPVAGARDGIGERLLELIHALFPDTRSLDRAELRQGCVDKWDSLGHIRLIMEVERAFDLKVPARDISDLTSYERILSFLLSKG